MAGEHEPWEELAAGYALDALEPADEQQFLTHVRSCEACGRTLAGLRALAGQIAYAAQPADPPDGLRQAILDGVAASGRPAAYPAAPAPGVARRRTRSRVHLAWVARAGAVVAVFALAVLALHLRDQRDVADAQAARLRHLVTVINDPTTRHAALTSDGGPRGSAYLSGDRVWIVVDGLAPNDARTSAYVLWWRDGSGRMHGIATFDVRRTDGPHIHAMTLPVPAADVTGLLISREKGRRIPADPSENVVAGALHT